MLWHHHRHPHACFPCFGTRIKTTNAPHCTTRRAAPHRTAPHSFTKREGRIVFSVSKRMVGDELRNRLGFAGLSFVDFLEALPRVACLKALPTQRLLDKYADKLAGTEPYCVSAYFDLVSKSPDMAAELYKEEADVGMGHTLEQRLPKLLDLLWGRLGLDADTGFTPDAVTALLRMHY